MLRAKEQRAKLFKATVIIVIEREDLMGQKNIMRGKIAQGMSNKKIIFVLVIKGTSEIENFDIFTNL